MARMFIYDGPSSYLCGGSIIATDQCNGRGVILTAAHCVVGDHRADNVDVGIGCTMTDCSDSIAGKYTDDFYVVHDDYDPSLSTSDFNWINNDLALVFLEEEITVAGAQPIELHHDMNVLNDNDEVTVFGYYGRCKDYPDCAGGSDIDSLEYATVNYMISQRCRRYWGRLVVGDEDFCLMDTPPGEQTTCGGDSGSPAVFEGMQLGLVSWGPGSCRPDYPTVMTSLPHYWEWVQSTMADHCSLERPTEVTPREEIIARMDKARAFLFPEEETEAVIEEYVKVDTDRAAQYLDGSAGHGEAVSVGNIVFLVLEIAGLFLISIVGMVLCYRRFADKNEEEEMKPLLDEKVVEI